MTTTKRYYEDLQIGKLETSQAQRVNKDQMLAFAAEYDPQYFHADEEAAQSSRFGEVIASGQYTMVLWRQIDHQIAHDIAWICGIAWDDVRWPVAVKADDELRATAECLEKRLSDSDPSRGVVKYRYQLLNQHDQIVFSCISTNLVETR
ncbi:MAG: MaoC/PaaZ C-terminal domain-containing protein [Pseudomonadota bacterium]